MSKLQNLKKILFTSDLSFPRATLAWASILWSIMLFWPGNTFDRPTYTMMGKFAPEWVWAAAFGFHGVFSMFAISRDHIKEKIDMCFEGVFGCLLWTSSCFFMIFSVYPPPAAISAEIVAAFSSWVILARYPIPGRGDV